MTRFCLVFAVLLALATLPAWGRPAAEIRKEMAAIRRSTNWGDPAAAKAANERIKKLAAELAGVGPPPEGAAPAAEGGGSATADPNAGGLDVPQFQFKVGQQIAEAAGRGEQGDILLATSVREQIVQEYRDDLDPQIKNPDVLAEMSTLIIDLSSPAAEAVIATMEKFRGIRTLVLTGGESGAPVDLPSILQKAAGYPLEQLYIVNFQRHVTALPPEIGQFRQLRVLAVFNNALAALPPQVGACGQLETLLVDLNPIRTVLPEVQVLPKLATLGVGKTGISAGERAAIHRLRPACQILTE